MYATRSRRTMQASSRRCIEEEEHLKRSSSSSLYLHDAKTRKNIFSFIAQGATGCAPTPHFLSLPPFLWLMPRCQAKLSRPQQRRLTSNGIGASSRTQFPSRRGSIIKRCRRVHICGKISRHGSSVPDSKESFPE